MTGGRGPRRLPGEAGIWLFIAGDMVVFALFFVVYLADRNSAAALFDRSQQRLDSDLGAANTLLLLTSSWFAALAVDAVRHAQGRRGRALLLGAVGCGLGFVAVKAVEYHEKFAAGITPVTNDFFMYYFMFTGIHLVHVVIGLGVLALLSRRAVDATATDVRSFENGATFWHMVDLLWIMLFALLYLVNG